MRSGPMSMARTVLAGLSAMALVACAASDPRVTIVDGWSIGPEFRCDAQTNCEAFVDVATQALTSQEPGHPAIAHASVHQEGYYPCTEGGGITQITRSGGWVPIVLLELEDGSRRAFGIAYPVGSIGLRTRERGPEVALWNCSDTGPFPPQYPTEVVTRV